MISVGVSITGDLLAATIIASAFAVIGPSAGYTGVHTWAESVWQNCVLGRCANLCSVIVLHLPSLFFLFFFFFFFGKFGLRQILSETKLDTDAGVEIVTQCWFCA